MMLRRVWFVAPALALLTAACGSEVLGPADLKQSDLQGSWKVTKYEYVKDTDSGKKFDLIADGHWTINAIVQSDGAYQLTFTPPGPTPSIDTGFIIAANGSVTISKQNQPPQTISPTLDGARLSFTEEQAVFDFGFDGSSEQADINTVWEKQ